MKKSIYIFLFLMSCGIFSQQTLVKSFSSDANSIEISTDGLDEIKILNSESEEIEVSLFDLNPNSHHILLDEEASILKIGFKLQFLENENVFRKYITKRLNRAFAVVKIPKNKSLIVLGNTIDVVSKNYNGNLNIYIDKGFVNLHKVQQDVVLKLFQGNVFASLSNSNIDIKSTNGTILVNEKLYPKMYEKTTRHTTKNFTVSSINANVKITF